MNKKLLYKTRRIYLIFLIVIFLLVAPLFYILSQKIYLKNTDETLMLYKTEFIKNSALTLTENDIPVWNRFNARIQIKKPNGLRTDSLYYTSIFNHLEQEDEPYRALNAPITIAGKPYMFSATISLLESEDLMANIALLFFVIILLVLVGLYIITQKLSVTLWQPFYETLHQIESFEIDKNKLPQLSKTNIEEFNRLNKSIESLIQKNLVIYENQREFVENAAHELQTPIAVFQAKIDMLIQREDITQGQSEILISLNESVSKLNRLNRNLLLLSKIDKNQFHKTQTFSIKESIEKQLEFFTEQAKQKKVTVKTNFLSDCFVNANIGLTEILISNLMLNAIKHNVKNGVITISVSDGFLEVMNTGKNEELLTDKLFNRFSKANDSTQGNGLGLAIVKKIAALNKWGVSYQFSDKTHIFSVRF